MFYFRKTALTDMRSQRQNLGKENISPNIQSYAGSTVNVGQKSSKTQSHPLSVLPHCVLQSTPVHSLDCVGQELDFSQSVFQFPPPLSHTCSIFGSGDHCSETVTYVVEKEGFLHLQLRSGVSLDIAPNLAVRMRNVRHDSTISLSACSTQMALVHPRGRVLQYGPRVEIQIEDTISIKNAKIHPKGASFTANNCALVYLLDEAGARSTSDMFHDLHASHIADTLFLESSGRETTKDLAVKAAEKMSEQIQYWRDREDHWVIGDLNVTQTKDGLVTMEREVRACNTKLVMKASPNNGKVRFDSRLVQVTASLGEESHLFLRAGDRRLHYSGQSSVFTVRNAGHSAGFDEAGVLRIF